MEINHLTDEQIQDYIDGNPVVNRQEIESHMEGCAKCAREMRHYRKLSMMLSSEPEFELAPDFASEVVAFMNEQGAEKFFHKLAQVTMWVAGAVVGLILLIQFTDFEEAFKGFTSGGEDGKGYFDVVVGAFQNLFAGSEANIAMIALAVAVIFTIFVIDRLISRARKDLGSTTGMLI